MSNIFIDVKNLSKSYKLYNKPIDRLKEFFLFGSRTRHKTHQVLSNINFSLHEGEVIGIVGRNGSGKSTMLKIIAEIVQPDSGNIIRNCKIASMLELGVGFDQNFTGLENLYFMGALFNISRKELDEILPDILEFSELGEYINQPVRYYSNGMKAKLGFSLMLHIEADLVIVDEVLAVGDEVFRQKAYSEIKKMISEGKSILLVTHNMSILKSYCTRALLLKDGNIIMDGLPTDVVVEYENIIKKRIENND